LDLKNLIYSHQEDIAIVQFNRPEAFNAFNSEMLMEMGAVLDDIQADPGVRAVVIKGNDQVFSGGADVRDFVNYGPLDVREYIELAHQIGYGFFTCPSRLLLPWPVLLWGRM
jgi:enoyl-CoA hydratase/carnithine racemase